ncbi:hypothetical protein Holit_00169 [Hollandina sp. SP2]
MTNHRSCCPFGFCLALAAEIPEMPINLPSSYRYIQIPAAEGGGTGVGLFEQNIGFCRMRAS